MKKLCLKYNDKCFAEKQTNKRIMSKAFFIPIFSAIVLTGLQQPLHTKLAPKKSEGTKATAWDKRVVARGDFAVESVQ